MRLLLVILLTSSLSLFGQSYFKDHFGASAGIVMNVGTHVNSIGLNVKGYYTDYFFQFNAGSTFYLHESSYGNRRKFWENRNAIGLVLLAGPKNKPIDFQLDGLNHQTAYKYGLGFNYLFYFDNKGTSQLSGAFGFHIGQLSVYHENDVFGGQARDRFRTGHLHASYLYNDFKIGAGINLWTGETRGTPLERIIYKGCPTGFRILEGSPYGKTSHGIAYGSLSYNLPYGQIVHLKLGVDSEHIRHIFQNRLIHDMGRFISNATPHYPRLDEFGCPVFDSKNVRPNRLFLQFGANDNWSN